MLGRMGFKSVHTRLGSFFEVYEIPYGQEQSEIASEIICDDGDDKEQIMIF
jgi:hypothetical protein